MEFNRRRPRSEIRDELRHVLTRPGPYLSVFLNIFDAPLAPDARLDAALRGMEVTDAARQAAMSAVNVSAMKLIDRAPDNGLLAMVVAADGTLVSSSFPDPPTEDVVRLGDAPMLGPFIEADQLLLHHVVAEIGQTGLSISAFPRHGEVSAQHLEGNDLQAAASVIAHVARETDTSLVVLCGASHALDQVKGHLAPMLPISIFLSLVDIDASTDDLGHEVVRAVADRSARRTVEILRIWRYHRSQGEGVDGIDATVAAFRRGAVSLLLIHDDPSDQRRAWFGDGIDFLSMDRDDALTSEEGGSTRHGRLVDVLLCLAIGQGIPVFIVPSIPDERLADGVGVILTDGLATADGLGLAIER